MYEHTFTAYIREHSTQGAMVLKTTWMYSTKLFYLLNTHDRACYRTHFLLTCMIKHIRISNFF